MATHRIPVVVFCEVDVASDLDAETVAPLAVRRALGGGGPHPDSIADLSVDAYGQHIPVRAVRVMEAGIAAGNGYLWTRASGKAYTEGRRS